MYNPEELIKNFAQLPQGSDRMAGIQYAISQADLAKDYPYMLYFRFECASEAFHCDDSMMFFLLLPEMQRLLDEFPDMQIPVASHYTPPGMVLWVYGNMLSYAEDYYQIPLGDVEVYLRDYKRIARKYGCSLLGYYRSHASFYMHMDAPKSAKSFEEYRLCRTNDRSTCWSCEQTFEVHFELSRGNEQKALKLAEPLYQPLHKCDNTPFGILGDFMSYYLHRGNLEEAASYYNRLQTALKNNKNTEMSFSTGDILLFLAKTNPEKAWRFYKKQNPLWKPTGNPHIFFEFSRGAAALMMVLEEQGTETVPLVLPQAAPLFREDGCYAVSALRYYYEDQLQEIARKFDQRSGTDYYAGLLSGRNGGKG